MKIHLSPKEVAHALELLLKEKGTPMTIDPKQVGIAYGGATFDMEVHLEDSDTIIYTEEDV